MNVPMSFTMRARVALSALFCALLAPTAAGAGESLPAYNVDLHETTVSGISSGAYMAVHFGVAHSAIVKGVGTTAGGPYLCAFDRVPSLRGADRHGARALHAGRSGFPQAGDHPDAVKPDGAHDGRVGALGADRRHVAPRAAAHLAFPRLQRRPREGAGDGCALRLLRPLRRPQSDLLQGQSQRRACAGHRRLRGG